MTISLDNIVRSFLIGQGRTTLHSYLRYLKYVIDILRKIAMQYSVMNKTILLRMDQKKAAQWPDDCIVPLAVGWKNGDRVEMYQLDSSIALTHSHVEDGISATPNSIFENFDQYNILTASTGQPYNVISYGLGYNFSGYFNVNHKAREIQFSSEVDSSRDIIFIYRSNGFNPKSKTTISEVFQQMCEAYIFWQDGVKRFGSASAETEARRINFEREQTDVLQILMPVTYQNILKARAVTTDFNKFAS
jgi:hypothetical protein